MVWVHPRPQFWFERMLVNQYEDHLWQEHFRMTRQTFEYICCLVGPDLVRQDTNMRKSIPVRKRVAIALWRLATGETCRSTGLTFGQGRSTALTMRDQFCAALLPRANEFIKFPRTEAETRRAMEGFAVLSDFPQIVGAIDGSHIPIKRPVEYPNDYYNRKSFHSLVLQGIADADGRFIHVSTGYAGSIHDARVLRLSFLPRKVDDGEILQSPVRRIARQNVKPLLVGDPAYKLTTWCMKPYPETATITQSQIQIDFNKSLSSARIVIEQAFGLLKGRWRCLLTKLDESVDKVPETITVCCILHNICSSLTPQKFAPMMMTMPHTLLPPRDTTTREHDYGNLFVRLFTRFTTPVKRRTAFLIYFSPMWGFLEKEMFCRFVFCFLRWLRSAITVFFFVATFVPSFFFHCDFCAEFFFHCDFCAEFFFNCKKNLAIKVAMTKKNSAQKSQCRKNKLGTKITMTKKKLCTKVAIKRKTWHKSRNEEKKGNGTSEPP